MTISDLEGLRGIMEFGEKPFKALGEHHVRFGVKELGLQGGELRLDVAVLALALDRARSVT